MLIDRLEAIERASDDLITLAKLTMPDPKHPDDVLYSLYKDAKHHRAIAAALEEVEKGTIKRLIITCPPRHGKSELAAKKFIPYFAGRNPEMSVIFGTYNQRFAEDTGKKVREIMMSNSYRQVFPHVELKTDSRASDRLETNHNGILAFVGRGGTTTGRGGHLLLLDDPIKDRKEANSKTIRDQVWDWFVQVVGTRMMDDNARIVLIQTRWHEDDLIGRLIDPTNTYSTPEERAQWKVIDLPAVAMEDDPLGRPEGEPLWPERFGKEFFEEKQRQDPHAFSCIYQGRPTVVGGSFFQADYLQTYRPHELPSDLRIYVSSDHAVEMDQRNDKTCLLVVGADTKDNIYVLPDTFLGRVDTFNAVEKMLGVMRERQPIIWWAEKSHISRSIGPFLRKRMNETSTYVTIHELSPAREDKITRAQAIHGRMSMRKVFFPSYAPWWMEARDQLLKFPNGQHDDFVDALAYLGLGLSLMVPGREVFRERNTPVNFTGFTLRDIQQAGRAKDRRARVAQQSKGW